ncbi:hypothetical protein BH24ACT4_BH24ACT4_00410 [soil metagenome]
MSTAVAPDPVAYDPYAYAIHEDPYPTYARLRAEALVYRNDEHGFWAHRGAGRHPAHGRHLRAAGRPLGRPGRAASELAAKVAIPHDGDDDAVRIANDSPFGLSGSVYAGDPDRAWAAARAIRTGTVSINGGLWYGGDVPFGGYKQSGVGREMGRLGFEEYTEAKSVAEPA